MKAPAPVLRSTIVAALGGLLFGFDTAVISGATGALERVFDLSRRQPRVHRGYRAGGHGRRLAYRRQAKRRVRPEDRAPAIAALYAVSSLGTGLAWDWYSFLAFRFLGGIAVGGASVVSPMYIAEISPAAIRGRLVATQQFNVCFGICLAYVSNYLIAVTPFISEAVQWRWMFAVQAFPSALFFLLVFTIPESPRWLVECRRVDDARRVLRGLQAADVEGEIGAIRSSIGKVSNAEPLFCRKYRFPIMAAVLLAAFNQLTRHTRCSDYAARCSRWATPTPGRLVAVVSRRHHARDFHDFGMMVIDKFGRKTLLLVGRSAWSALRWRFSSTWPTPLPTSAGESCGISVGNSFWSFQGAVIGVLPSPNAVRATTVG